MDQYLAERLSNEEAFEESIAKIAREYAQLGKSSLDYWTPDFDVAHDMLMCYAPLNNGDYEKLSKGHPKRFILPMSATQITTMATFVAQVLFGQETPHKVSGRGPEDEIPAEYVNQLLRWNSEQQATYMLGYLWVQDALVVNRGIFYNYWAPIYSTSMAQEQVKHPVSGELYWRPARKQTVVGGFNKMDLISPYEFYCDPALPLWRMQEGRFAGHRTMVPFVDLERRSKLPPSDPQYVLPSAVQKLRDKKSKNQGNGITIPDSKGGTGPADSSVKTSYTAYQRTKSSAPNNQTANKDDKGVIALTEMWIKLVPADTEIYGESSSTDPTIFQFLIAEDQIVLSVNESTYAHGMFPYSVGEARPSALHQFAPSWMLMLKGLQDYVDWLKNRHQEALSRTVGNIFIYDPTKVDVTDFLNPEKEGLLIALKPEAAGAKINEVIQQVPLKDMTENFQTEMVEFARMSENITGANSYMQGQTSGNASATEFAGTQQMAAGRLSSVARILSAQGLVPQTKQFVSNYQQFLTVPQAVRFTPSENTPDYMQAVAALVLTKDLIQGSFDFIAHDGTLPGSNGPKVAAITRLLESAALFPDVFMPGPGNLNPRKLIFAAAKAAGVSIENFKYGPNDMPPLQAQSPPMAPNGVSSPQPPPSGGARPPGPAPAQISSPQLPPITMPTAMPPQARPGNSV